jgi:hypothetical protein
LKLGQLMIVNSGMNPVSSARSGRRSRLRMNSACQAYSVITRD